MGFCWLLFLQYWFLSSFIVVEGGKIKMVDEPFSFNAAQNGAAVRGDSTQESNLILRYYPEKPSGPPYLIENLHGKCFSMMSNNYKYELCPFSNVTQREQAYRWNAFNGILGVWKEWLVDGNNFTSMHMVHGDPCAGNLERETKVNLTCGIENTIVSVNEPSMCKYEIIFKTPYACPRDVFYIYPVLSEGGKIKWKEIEEDYVMKITTVKGYRKRKKNLLTEEGHSTVADLRKKTGGSEYPSVANEAQQQHEQQRLPITSSGIFAQDIINVNNRFSTKQECDVEYTRLLGEVEVLREQLRNINLMNVQAALVKPGPTIETTSTEEMLGQNHESINQTNASNYLDGNPHRNINEKHKKGDLGLYDENITDVEPLKHRKLKGPVVDNENILRKVPANNNNSLSKVKRMLKKKKRGDDGVLDENNYPMRNLMGRLEYEANIISRFKVHGRLRDGLRKGGEYKLLK